MKQRYVRLEGRKRPKLITLWPIHTNEKKIIYTEEMTIPDDSAFVYTVRILLTPTNAEDDEYPDRYKIEVRKFLSTVDNILAEGQSSVKQNVAYIDHTPAAAEDKEARRKWIENAIVSPPWGFSDQMNSKDKSLKRACEEAIPIAVDVIEADSFFRFQ